MDVENISSFVAAQLVPVAQLPESPSAQRPRRYQREERAIAVSGEPVITLPIMSVRRLPHDPGGKIEHLPRMPDLLPLIADRSTSAARRLCSSYSQSHQIWEP